MDVLIVEDDLIWSERLLTALEDAGFRCLLARSVGETMGLFRRMDFGLLILDLLLPDGASASLSNYIRMRFPNVPILVITGSRAFANGDYAGAISADFLLRKPIEVEQAVMVAQHLATSAAGGRRLRVV